MSNLQLIGEVDTRDDELRRLRAEVETLQDDLRQEKLRNELLERANVRAISQLRQSLSPVYQALQMVFGQMDAIGPAAAEPMASGNNAKWESIKQRLAPRLRDAVDILLLQGSMRRTQMASALKMDYSNCTKNVVGVLLRQGWLVDNGGSLSLKEL